MNEYNWLDWVEAEECPHCESTDVDGVGDGPNAVLQCRNCGAEAFPSTELAP